MVGLGTAAKRVRVLESDWFNSFDSEHKNSFDVIVSNPPYCKGSDFFGESVLEWEPEDALISGQTGLEDLIHIVEQSPGWLQPNGSLVLEMAPDQTSEMESQAKKFFQQVEVFKDLTQRTRGLIARHHT